MNMKELQEKQRELDTFIIESKGLQELSQRPDFVNALWCAGFSELYEIKGDIFNAEEWIDMLHFVLSVANNLDIKLSNPKSIYDTSVPIVLRLEELTKSWTEAMDYSKTYKFWSSKEAKHNQVEFMLNDCIHMIDAVMSTLGTDLVTEYLNK